MWAAGLSSQGINPRAYGEHMGRAVASMSWPDHPCVCGEHQSGNAASTTDVGSPPRLWGAPNPPSRRWLPIY